MEKAGNAELVFVPLGGVGEIGMNFALYGFGPADAREWIIIDVGVSFPDANLPGVNLVLPDTRFIEEKLNNLRGIVITHAHEDHYGALHDIWPCLLYTSMHNDTFTSIVKDFYLTNPIARASSIMAKCSALAKNGFKQAVE